MADFSIQAQTYDKNFINLAITDLEQEIQEERDLETTLNTQGTSAKIADATKFVTENKEMILDQHAALLSLNLGLRAIVKNNKDTQSLDQQYDELVKSEEYTILATKMAEIKSVVHDLRDFLVKEGVRGHVVQTPSVEDPVPEISDATDFQEP